MTKKEIFQGKIEDLLMKLFVYDRREDEELSVDDVYHMIESGEVTLGEVVGWFTDALKREWD